VNPWPDVTGVWKRRSGVREQTSRAKLTPPTALALIARASANGAVYRLLPVVALALPHFAAKTSRGPERVKPRGIAGNGYWMSVESRRPGQCRVVLEDGTPKTFQATTVCCHLCLATCS